MEFAEALLALGVGGTSEWETLSATALKMAYLKKVRAHPPERDPQGFQRVREAYELLRAIEPGRDAFGGASRFFPSTATGAERTAPTPAHEADETVRVAISLNAEPGGPAFDHLQQALTAQQYDAAADAMIEISVERIALEQQRSSEISASHERLLRLVADLDRRG